MLIQHCDVFFGFKLVPDAYPDWLTITRPYYRGPTSMSPPNRPGSRCRDMPTTRAIGATIGTAADMRLTQYLLAAPAARRWDKYPMASDEAALRAVMDGTAGAALVWARRSGRCERPIPPLRNCRRWRPAPLPLSTADVGAMLLRKQTFLRTSIDQAIASLTADGTIAGILEDENFPGDARAR